jgi:pimeloyl-ACP methyl ester carboxylesterase
MESQSINSKIESINGIELYYELQGEGEPLLLLHGFTGAGVNWKLIFNQAPTGYQLIIPDLRGHGHSTNPSQNFTHRQSALDIYALLDRLKIDRFKAIGLSCGGKTLLHMATQQPARIEAMVLVSTAHYFPTQARSIMNQMTPDSHSEAEWQMMRQWHKHGDDQIRHLWRIGHEFKDSYDDMNFTPPYLSTITARTLIVHGDRDPLYPINIPVEIYNAIPGSYLWIIPNGGHSCIFEDNSKLFQERSLSFLNGDWR